MRFGKKKDSPSAPPQSTFISPTGPFNNAQESPQSFPSTLHRSGSLTDLTHQGETAQRNRSKSTANLFKNSTHHPEKPLDDLLDNSLDTLHYRFDSEGQIHLMEHEKQAHHLVLDFASPIVTDRYISTQLANYAEQKAPAPLKKLAALTTPTLKGNSLLEILTIKGMPNKEELLGKVNAHLPATSATQIHTLVLKNWTFASAETLKAFALMAQKLDSLQRLSLFNIQLTHEADERDIQFIQIITKLINEKNHLMFVELEGQTVYSDKMHDVLIEMTDMMKEKAKTSFASSEPSPISLTVSPLQSTRNSTFSTLSDEQSSPLADIRSALEDLLATVPVSLTPEGKFSFSMNIKGHNTKVVQPLPETSSTRLSILSVSDDPLSRHNSVTPQLARMKAKSRVSPQLHHPTNTEEEANKDPDVIKSITITDSKESKPYPTF